jgi:transcriptional regulator with XRE-family HTH domain
MGESANTIGRKLKTLRLKKGLKRSSVASKAGISYDYLTKIENGQRSPNIAMLERICNAVGASVEQLLATSVELLPVKKKETRGLYPLGKGKPVPLIGWTRAGFWEEASDGALLPGAAEDWLYSELGGGRGLLFGWKGTAWNQSFVKEITYW